ncbi:MAG: hypothetical protein KDK53_24285 [Maritimibacter sp.]|nr:hypothetical protein [Maritimibacter sp.]
MHETMAAVLLLCGLGAAGQAVADGGTLTTTVLRPETTAGGEIVYRMDVPGQVTLVLPSGETVSVSAPSAKPAEMMYRGISLAPLIRQGEIDDFGGPFFWPSPMVGLPGERYPGYIVDSSAGCAETCR